MSEQTTPQNDPSPGQQATPTSPADVDASSIPRHLIHHEFVTSTDEANESLHAWLDEYFLNKQNNLLLSEKIARLAVNLITGKLQTDDSP